jgi:hydrogenase maturation factor
LLQRLKETYIQAEIIGRVVAQASHAILVKSV